MAEQGSFDMEAVQNMMQTMVMDLKQDNLKLKEDLKKNNLENTKRLADKITDNNTDALETKFQQALLEQDVRIENQNKELRGEWKKDLKYIYKLITKNFNDKLNTVKPVSYTHL